MSCFQLSVGGSGSASPDTVKFPGAYGASDPGILINIYQSLTDYTGVSHFILISDKLSSSICQYSVPGPTPYATTSPAPASTAYPTTATWNTALQPSTVPTSPVATSISPV